MNDCQGARSLYICYMGVREPLIQTQVLPYLRQLARSYQMSLLTFDRTDEDAAEWRRRLAGDGIQWESLRYHKRPTVPATFYDIAVGAAKIVQLDRKGHFDLLHARSHVPALMASIAKRITKSKLLFDIRGFFPEEYVDMGLWPEGGTLFRVAKRVEKRLLAAADGFVVLTNPAKDALFASETRPVEVIPCCVDLERFKAAESLDREALRRELGLADRRVLVYVGALGGMYLTDQLADFLAVAHEHDPKYFALVLTQSDPAPLADRLRSLGLRDGDFTIQRVAPAEIPKWLRASDLAVSFIKPTYAKIASSPTKIAEYLASGLPVISNAGIGELDRQLPDGGVGVIFNDFKREAYRAALTEGERLAAKLTVADRCRVVARDAYDLDAVGGARYARLYDAILG